jgi:predicted metal-binding membrane protein
MSVTDPTESVERPRPTGGVDWAKDDHVACVVGSDGATHQGSYDLSYARCIPNTVIMAPANAPWSAIEFAFVFVMWTVMMVGMMVPSAVPIIVMYARVGRYTQAQGTPLGATAYFSIGYVLVWGVFSLFATLTQWGLERAGLLDDAMASTSNILGAVVFVAAGTYQWTRIKYVCLTQCQMPFAFLIRHGGFRRDWAWASLMQRSTYGRALTRAFSIGLPQMSQIP